MAIGGCSGAMSTSPVAIMVTVNQKALDEEGCCFVNSNAVKDYRDCWVSELPMVNDTDLPLHQLTQENSDYMLHRGKTSCFDH